MTKWWIAAVVWAGAGMAEPAQVIERFDAGAGERWRFIADGVMGGVSEGAAQITSEGLHLTGQVRLENNGGFIQVRRELQDALPADTDALVLQVRGNGARYTVFLRTGEGRRPWHNYKASFTAPDQWSEVRLPFAGFERSHDSLGAQLDPNDIVSIGLAGYGAAYQADLWVSEVAVD